MIVSRFYSLSKKGFRAVAVAVCLLAVPSFRPLGRVPLRGDGRVPSHAPETRCTSSSQLVSDAFFVSFLLSLKQRRSFRKVAARSVPLSAVTQTKLQQIEQSENSLKNTRERVCD